MKAEKTEKLFKDFPLLYGDRNKPMTKTAMCWGIETGDGWYDLIHNLSSKLESIIQKTYEDNPNVNCEICWCSRDKHYGSGTKHPKKCLAVKRHPTKVWHVGYSHKKYKWKYWKYKIVKVINRALKIFYYELQTCYCDEYSPDITRASQVKEKFGGLRFYITRGTDEIFDLISKAEAKSYRICENCGNSGKPRNDGWIRTLCAFCAL